MENEVWKDIKGFEGRYQVSNMGRVRSLDRWSLGERLCFIKGMMLKPSLNNYGYLRVSLSDGRSNRKHYEVHRLVALHFVPGYKKGLVVNHKNEVKTDNRAENLEWCTYQYNLNYSDIIEWKRKPVYQYDLDGNFIKKFKCRHQAEQELGFTIVNAIYVSKRGYARGFLFSLEPHTKEYWNKVTKENKGKTRRVAQYDDNGNETARFNTVTEAAKAMNVTYNRRYGTAIQRRAESNWKKVAQYDLAGNLIATYDSAKKAAKVTGCNYISLCGWCRGAHTPKNKYRWSYI